VPQSAAPVPVAQPQPIAVAPTRVYEAPPPRPIAAQPQATSSAKGYLSVICIPACDRIELDGVSLGGGPVFKRATSVGSHRVKLVSSGGSKIISKIVTADSVSMVRESMP
jgi:hypothetical protein